jgi:phosphate transport system substrate-binding protein
MKRPWTVTLLCALAAAGCGGGKEQPKKLVGKGSTFVAPLMVLWSNEYQKTEGGCEVDYSPFGSGAGIKAILERKVDFGCTDAPLTDEQIAQARAAGGEVLHVPLVMGAVVPAYNLPGVEGLRFTGPVLADIFLGKIKRWDDKALKDLNPGAALPDRGIQVVHRSDGSGTTYVWADYLSKVSPEWKSGVGVGTEVAWPSGVGEAGNEGVANRVQNTAGSIGYVELSYAVRRELSFGLVQNREREFVKAGPSSVRQAARNALSVIPEDLRFSLTDPPGKGSYPVCGTTWAVVYLRQPADKGRLLSDFLWWALDKGQEKADLLFYLPLPEPLLERAQKQLKRIQSGQ